MRAWSISLFFVLASVAITAIFHYKAPRRQAHLAALQATVDSALKPFPSDARFYFRTDSGVAQDYGIWCRLFASPRRLLLLPATRGDTVFYLRPRRARAGFPEKPTPLEIKFFIQS